jgi:lipid A 3-O-deacylase
MKMLWCVVVFLPYLVAAPAGAQNITTLTLENDLYASGNDQNYTNGVKASLMQAKGKMPEWAEVLADNTFGYDPTRSEGVTYSVGQSMYTPSNISLPIPNPKDSPYAAVLYGSVGITTANADLSEVNDIEVTAGMVGPAAMGENAQKYIHKRIDSDTPNGWAYQLKNEPVFTLGWQRRWPYRHRLQMDGLRVSATPHVAANVGNLLTSAGAGLMLTLAPIDAPLMDTPQRVRPSVPSTGYFEKTDGWSWQLFAGTEGRAVARNLVLDGNTFADGPRVDKRPFVTDLQAGAAVLWRNLRLSYSAVYRSKEFYTQEESNIFGTLSLSVLY